MFQCGQINIAISSPFSAERDTLAFSFYPCYAGYMDWSSCLASGTDVATLQCVPIVFNNLIDAALIFAGVVTVVFIIIAGYKLMNSGGDQKKVADAKGTLTYAIIGLVIILMSFFLVNFIAYTTGVDCIKKIGFSTCK
jgi:hypothetical protein